MSGLLLYYAETAPRFHFIETPSRAAGEERAGPSPRAEYRAVVLGREMDLSAEASSRPPTHKAPAGSRLAAEWNTLVSSRW